MKRLSHDLLYAAMKNAPPESFTIDIIDELITLRELEKHVRQGSICRWCQRPSRQSMGIEHVLGQLPPLEETCQTSGTRESCAPKSDAPAKPESAPVANVVPDIEDMPRYEIVVGIEVKRIHGGKHGNATQG